MTMIKYDNLERDTNLGQGSELQLPSSPGRSESGQLNPESVVRDDMTMMMTTELVTMVNLVIYPTPRIALFVRWSVRPFVTKFAAS